MNRGSGNLSSSSPSPLPARRCAAPQPTAPGHQRRRSWWPLGPTTAEEEEVLLCGDGRRGSGRRSTRSASPPVGRPPPQLQLQLQLQLAGALDLRHALARGRGWAEESLSGWRRREREGGRVEESRGGRERESALGAGGSVGGQCDCWFAVKLKTSQICATEQGQLHSAERDPAAAGAPTVAIRAVFLGCSRRCTHCWR